ncbi:MAG: hypothetical protein M1334_04180 [Patescibacteria group bacterium]|nr:hypothetical protein [Patescibacteria group bacterium]
MKSARKTSDKFKNIYDEDQKDRKEDLYKKNPELAKEKDAQRLMEILEAINSNQLKTPGDYFYAAMVLQHGGETKYYRLAYKFAKKAAEEGYRRQKGEVDPLWLAAAAKDRYLMSQGKPQLYGTQFRKDSADSPWYLYEVDLRITDKERAGFHVPPLAESEKKVEELNKK